MILSMSGVFQPGSILDTCKSVRVYLIVPLSLLKIPGIKGPKALGIPSFVDTKGGFHGDPD